MEFVGRSEEVLGKGGNSLEALQSAGEKIMLFFWASWHDPSKSGGQMQESFKLLANKYPDVHFLLIEAEENPEISEKFSIAVVPTFIALSGATEVGKLEGVNPSELVKLVKRVNENRVAAAVSKEDESVLLWKKLQRLIHAAPVMVFMKGVPDEPKCGFSRKIVEMFREESISFKAFNILSDEDVRAALKEHSDWPTYPQVYVNGSFMGGLDVMKEMKEEGSLKEQLFEIE